MAYLCTDPRIGGAVAVPVVLRECTASPCQRVVARAAPVWTADLLTSRASMLARVSMYQHVAPLLQHGHDSVVLQMLPIVPRMISTWSTRVSMCQYVASPLQHGHA